MKDSKYNLIVPYQNKLLFYNVLNSSFSYIDNYDNSFDSINDFFKSSIALKKGYVHDDFYDEEKAFLMKKQDQTESRFLNLVVLPTMQCNFKCPYCYECDKDKVMGKETVRALEKFLLLHLHEYSGLHIGWFGGEPLLKMDVIESINNTAKRISKKLGKMFFSSITTNGYLLSIENFQKLLDLNIKSYTVTLDGTKEYHDKYRKLKSDAPTYNRLIDNLINISKNKSAFLFNVRMNVSKENYSNLDTFIEEMYKLFGKDNRFDLTLVLTSDWGGETINQMKDDLLQSTDFLYDVIIKHKDKFKFKNMFKIIEGESCQFANRNSYVIDTEGNLLKCTVHLNHEKIKVGKILPTGNIEFNYSNLSYWNLHDYSFQTSNNCKNCKMLFVCKERLCLAAEKYSIKCGYSTEKLEKMLIAKYELDPESFYYVNKQQILLKET